ncbi:hypothetical protein P154DRAFT_115481 [Amniculicola lignicola CBS 123094]|uniref:Uncharacterized protein n=1 Tax=Amniculicola lignicola CBS 123094 TaxID=1392246 RepID=A0A6A5X311_9PLEO|nr:hypothetical protein P154DRAFT_115481 [Amniculicola lignicola CBS 123094]
MIRLGQLPTPRKVRRMRTRPRHLRLRLPRHGHADGKRACESGSLVDNAAGLSAAALLILGKECQMRAARVRWGATGCWRVLAGAILSQQSGGELPQERSDVGQWSTCSSRHSSARSQAQDRSRSIPSGSPGAAIHDTPGLSRVPVLPEGQCVDGSSSYQSPRSPCIRGPNTMLSKIIKNHASPAAKPTKLARPSERSRLVPRGKACTQARQIALRIPGLNLATISSTRPYVLPCPPERRNIEYVQRYLDAGGASRKAMERLLLCS